MLPKLEDQIKCEISDLLKIGETLVAKYSSSGSEPNFNEATEISSWVSRLGNLIRKLYSKDSQVIINYEAALNENNFYYIHSNHYLHVACLVGLIKTIQHEVNHGLLQRFNQLIHAEIFSDFLEMAEFLLIEGYKDPAAVLVGGVLEDSLRKLADNNNIPTQLPSGKKLTLEPLNIELGKNGIYNKLIQKQITSWGDLRNKAAHGEFSGYDKGQVEMMLMFVQKFCSDYIESI